MEFEYPAISDIDIEWKEESGWAMSATINKVMSNNEKLKELELHNNPRDNNTKVYIYIYIS